MAGLIHSGSLAELAAKTHLGMESVNSYTFEVNFGIWRCQEDCPRAAPPGALDLTPLTVSSLHPSTGQSGALEG